MNVYRRIFKNGWKEASIYRFDVIVNGLLSIFKILIVFLMWNVIFRDRTEVQGFTFSMMITYYIVVMILQYMDRSEGIANTLASEIRDGKYSKYIVKPVNAFFYYLFKVFSKMIYYLTFSIISVIFLVVCFNKYFLLPSSMGNFIAAVAIFLLSIMFVYGFNYLLVILTFWFTNTSSFFRLKSKIMEFLTGALIPLTLLPDAVVGVFKFFPFYYVYYYPASVYLGQNVQEIPTAFAVLIMWNCALFITIALVYKKAIKSFSGVGI